MIEGATQKLAPARAVRVAPPEEAPPGWRPGPEATDGARLWILQASELDPALAVREPTVARGPGAAALPLFSLTLTVERQPSPDESSLVPLVRGGSMAVTLDVTPTDAELAIAYPLPATRPTALFLRGTSYALVRAVDGVRVAEAENPGFGGRLALRAVLAQDDAVAVLRAVRGESSGLEVVAELTYSPPPPPPQPFTFDLRAVWAFLHARVDEDRVLLEIDLVAYFAALIRIGAIVMREPSSDPKEAATQHLAALIQACASLLAPVRALADRYRLVDRAPDSSERTPAARDAAMRTLRIVRPLQEALAPLTRRFSIDALVTAVRPGDRGLEPLGARVAQTRGTPAPKVLASFGDDVSVSLNVALRSGRALKPSAAVLAHSGLAIHSTVPGRWQLDDLVQLTSASGNPMPRIDDESAPLFADRKDAGRFWYAPELSVIMPAAQDSADTSPFVFSFRTVGHDDTGRPGLEASIRVRLRAGMSIATQQAWEARGKPTVTAVPLGGLSVEMVVPFRSPTGRASAQSIRASSLTSQGDVHEVTFVLTDQWARLAYGALAVGDFQEAPARIGWAYTFSAEIRSPRALSAAAGQRVESMAVMRPRPVLAAASTIHLSQAAALAPGRPPIVVRPPHQPVPPRPPLQPLPQRPYVVQTQGRSGAVPIHVPCSTHGAVYVQLVNDRVQAIGCQDAFQLGVVELRLFDRVALDFGVPAPFTVLRSLQVPGRFLILPSAYTVARFEPGDARAYRPALFLFATVDAAERDRTRCVVAATLEPAVSGYWRDALLAKLESDVHPSPELIWPGDLDTSPTFAWALGSGGLAAVEVDAVPTPEGVQVALSTGVEGVLLLKSMIESSGVLGSVSFPLADGTTLRSTAVVDLARVAGPFIAGPADVSISQNRAAIHNRIEQAIDLGALAVRTASGRVTVPVGKRLGPGEQVIVSVPADARRPTVDCLPVGEVGSFEEIRSYVEDIYVTVVLQANLDFTSIASLSVEACIAGIEGSVRASLSADEPRAELTLLLPLTTYVAQPTLRFAITCSRRDGQPVTGAWRDWRLDALGGVIEIRTADLP